MSVFFFALFFLLIFDQFNKCIEILMTHLYNKKEELWLIVSYWLNYQTLHKKTRPTIK